MENSAINHQYFKNLKKDTEVKASKIDAAKLYQNKDNTELLNDIGKDFFLSDYNSEEWEEVTPQEGHKFACFGEQFVFKTDDGTVIKADKDDNVRVKINKQTGEIAVIGARNATVDIEGDSKVTVVESTVDKIANKTGNATISVRGAHSNIKKIVGGNGNQTVNVADGALVEKIKTKGGDDVINIQNGGIAGKIDSGKGNDTINVSQSIVKNNIKSGKGDDNINIEKSDINKKIKSGSGDDKITVKDSSLSGTVKTGRGNDNIEIEGSTVSGKLKAGSGDDNISVSSSKVESKIKTGYGDDNVQIKDSTTSKKSEIKAGNGSNTINIENSQINGKITVSSSSSNVNIKDSIVNKLNSKSEVTSTDSAIGKAKGTYNITRNITSLDTTQGEFAGFEKVEGTTEGTNTIYSLPDGTTIETDKSGGEVYINYESGKIVLNGINNAKITAEAQVNITALNSNIINQNDLSGEVEYRNSIVDEIKTNNTSDITITGSRSNINNIKANDGNVNLNITDNSNIGKITANGDDNINVQMDSGSIDKINAKDNVSVNISAKNDKQNININKIITKNGFINADFQGANVNKIKTSNGDLNLRATSGSYGIIINKSKNGNSNIDINNANTKKIKTQNTSNINIKGGNIDNIKTGQADDTVNLSDTNVKKVNTGNGSDNISVNNSEVSKKIKTKDDNNRIIINNSTVKTVVSNGETAIDNSKIKTAKVNGNIAIEASEINKFKASERDNNISVTDSIIDRLDSIKDDNVYIDNFGETKIYNDVDAARNNNAVSVITGLNEQDNEELYVLLSSLAGDEISSILAENGENLSKEEIINLVMQNPNENLSKIKEMMLKEMEGALKTLKENNTDTNKTKGIYGRFASDNKKEIEAKTEVYEKAVASDDMTSIMNAYKLLVGEKADAERLSQTNEAIQFVQNLSDDNINMILDVLSFVANDQDYKTTEQDGIIKTGIATINNLYDIGTTRKEVEAYIETFRKDVAELKEKYNAGELSKEDFAAEYKRLTGNALTSNNVNTLLDTVRGNDKFDNTIKEKITDYQSTQNTIFQVGEFTVVVVAGAVVTFATGGAAGPAVAAALSSLGKMGIAITATTVSFLTKMAIEAAERQTNATTDDDMTPEEVGKTAALMYAGCVAGQFGNYMGALVGQKFGAVASKLISNQLLAKAATAVVSKTADVTADSVLSLGLDYIITGEGKLGEEFVQNLKSEMIGLIQSKLSNAYFKAHPEIQIKNELYKAAKKMGETAGYQAVMDKYGLKDYSAKGLSFDEVTALIKTQIAIGALGSDTVTRILTEDADELVNGGKHRTDTEDVKQKPAESEDVKPEEAGKQKPAESGDVKPEEAGKQKAKNDDIGTKIKHPDYESAIKRTETLADGSTKDIYTDATGRILGEQEFDISGNLRYETIYRTDTTKPIKDVVIEYAKDGVTIKAKNVYNADSSYRHETYNKEGKVIKAVEYTPAGKISSSYDLKYNADGQLIQMRFFDSNNNQSGSKIYEYDSQGRVTSETIIDKSNKVVRKYIKTYEADGSVKTKIELENGTIVDFVDKAAVEALHTKIVQQQMIATKTDIEDIVKELTQNGVSREEAIAALSLMTQYTSMPKLVQLAELIKTKVGGEFDLYLSAELGVSANAALRYIGKNKKHFKFSTFSSGNKTIILDEYAIKYLENLQKTNPSEFETLKKNCLFVEIEGWDLGYNMYTQDGNISTLKQKTEMILSKAKALQAQRGISFEEAVKQAMDNGTTERIKNLGLENEVKKIELNDNGSSVETIVRNVEPMTISSEKLCRIIDTLCEEYFPNGDPDKILKAKNLLLSYFNECIDIYSPQRLGQTLKSKYSEIETTISGLRKSDGSRYSMQDDIIYIIPESGKSYDTIALQYAKINGIDPSQFVYMDSNPSIKTNIYKQEGKIFVVLDDVVGSGDSMLTQDNGAMYILATPGKDSHIILSPIVSGETGETRIKTAIKNKGQNDFLLINDRNVKKPLDKTNFYQNLSSEDQTLLLQLLQAAGSLGYVDNSAYAICFPYMAPDNDAGICDILFSDLMPNNYAIKSKMNKKKIKEIVSQLDLLDK